MIVIIPKLNNLNNPESFIQINLIKGYKYVDKAGEIVNTYHKDNTAPVFTMNLNELRIFKPLEKVEEIKVSPQLVWMRFLATDSLDMVATIFVQESKKILKSLEIEKVNRIGWRNYFIYEFDTPISQEKFFAKLNTIKDTKLNTINVELKTAKKFKATLGLQPVIKNDTNTPAVLFDIDISQTGEVDLKDFSKLLKEFREYLVSETGFLRVVNNVLSSQ